MGAKRMPGLRERNGIWHIEKQIRGYGILRESTGTRDYEEAERYLMRRVGEIREAVIYGVRPARSFEEAAAKYLMTNQDMKSIRKAAKHLQDVMPYVGNLRLDRVHDGTLEPFIQARKRDGVKNSTINLALTYVRSILNSAARKWRDENGLTWLVQAPLITMLAKTDARKPYPLACDEQRILFAELPKHLHDMALFKVNTGTREQEVCRLRWEWEQYIPELERSIFVVPDALVKNGEDRLIILNDIAQRIIDSKRGEHPYFVFTYQEEFGETAPDGFARIRVHDLKHTFGRRLRAAGVALETRKVLLGHKNGDITTHYSAPELTELLEAANRVTGGKTGKIPSLTLIRAKKVS